DTGDPVTQQPLPSRRRFLRNAAAVAVVSTSAGATTTTTTTPATTQAADAIAAEDIAALVRLTGHDFTADEQAMMSGDIAANRAKYRRWRTQKMDPRTEPAIHFDPRLPGVTYPSGGESSFALSQAQPIEYHGEPASLAFATAAELSRLIHAKKITSVELTKMYLHRLDTIGRRLNAVITLTDTLALRQAERCDRELALGRP